MLKRSADKRIISGVGLAPVANATTFGTVKIPANTKWYISYLRHAIAYVDGNEVGTIIADIEEDGTKVYEDYAKGHGTSTDYAEGEPVSGYIGPFSDEKTLRLRSETAVVTKSSACLVLQRVKKTSEEKHAG